MKHRAILNVIGVVKQVRTGRRKCEGTTGSEGIITMRHCHVCRRHSLHFLVWLSALFAVVWLIVVGILCEEIGVIMRWWWCCVANRTRPEYLWGARVAVCGEHPSLLFAPVNLRHFFLISLPRRFHKLVAQMKRDPQVNNGHGLRYFPRELLLRDDPGELGSVRETLSA